MYKKGNKLTKAQTALEYIAACVAFGGIGIATFMAVNQASLVAARGDQDNLTDATLLGKTLNDGVADTALPEDWSQPQEGLGGAIPKDTADAGASHQADWNNIDEDGFLATTGGAGDHWVSGEADDHSRDLPDADATYSSTELQGEFNSLSDKHFGHHEAGYTEAGREQINENLNDGWFMAPVEPSPSEE